MVRGDNNFLRDIEADNGQLTITPNKKLIIRNCARIIFSLKGVVQINL